MQTVALIDADILVYQVATQVERPIDWGDDLWTLHSDFGEAVSEMNSRIKQIQEDLKADKLVFALSCADGKYFRKELYSKYKLNRKSTRKPLVWKPLRGWAHENHQVSERTGLEGDDCLGILATKLWPGTNRIIVSIDKDFKTIPCTYYNLKSRETKEISAAEADYWFITQTLTGDTTDGYPGCPGVGPKSAEKVLEPCWSKDRKTFDLVMAWGLVLQEYKKKGLGEGVALQQARMARILRASDYDFSTKQVKLWEPPTCA